MSGQWTWEFSSVKDPRFRGYGVGSGMHDCAAAIERAILDLEKKHGVEAPDDIVTQGNKE